MVVPRVNQVFSSAAENLLFITTRTAKLHFPKHKQLCVTIQEFERRKNEKKPTQILQVINSGKIAAGILQAIGAAPTNIFPDLTNL